MHDDGVPFHHVQTIYPNWSTQEAVIHLNYSLQLVGILSVTTWPSKGGHQTILHDAIQMFLEKGSVQRVPPDHLVFRDLLSLEEEHG